MDIEKKNALIYWIKAMVHDADITSLSEIKENSTIMLHLLSKIDMDLQYPISTNEKNISWVCQYLKEMFNSDVLDENLVQLGNEIEIGKLLCLILELTLTSTKNSDYISKIQCLSEDVQTNIMSMTKMVCDHCQKFNLGDIMERKLRISVTEEDEPIVDVEETRRTPSREEVINISKTAVVDSSTPVPASPHLSRISLNGSLGENTSPLAAFASSPQAFCRRVMIENRKLKQKVRHSELFSRRRTEFEEQLTQDVESEKKTNERLLKEQDQLLQKIKDQEDIIIKCKEEIEFLQLESSSKDKEVMDKIEEVKKSNDLLSELQSVVDKCSEMEIEIKDKQTVLEEEIQKNSSLKLENNELKDELEQQKICIENERSQHRIARQTFEEREREMMQIKKDYLDQVDDLQEKLAKQEKQMTTGGNAETLSDALKKDTELLTLKEKCKKLQNEVNVQDSTLMNMAHQSKQLEAQNEKFQAEIENYKNEMKNLTQKYDETTKNYKKQSDQYMDQISTLLKQVEEHSQRNEGMNSKMANAEEKYKLLEKKLEKYEESQSKINEQIQQQSTHLTEKEDKLIKLTSELASSKNQFAQKDLEKAQLDAKIQILTEERNRLVEIEKQHQSTVFENQRLHGVDDTNRKLTDELDALRSVKSQCQQLSKELELRDLRLAQLRKDNDQIAVLEANLDRINEENTKLKTVEKDFLALSTKHDALKVIEEKYQSVKKQNELLKEYELNYKQALTEVSMLKATLDDYRKSITNSENNQKGLLNEITELRSVKLQYNHLLTEQESLKKTITALESTVKEKNEEMEKMKTTCEALLKEIEELKQKLEEHTQAHEKKVSQFEDNENKLKEQIAILTATSEASDKRVMEKDNELATVRSSSENELKVFQNKIAALDAERDSREQDVLTFKERIAFLEDIEVKYKTLTKEHDLLKTAETKAKSYQGEVTTLQGKLEQLMSVQERFTELQQSYRSLEDEKIHLEVQSAQKAQDAVKKIKQFTTKLSVFESMEKEYKELRNEYEFLKKDNDSNKSKMEELQTTQKEYRLLLEKEKEKSTDVQDNEFEEKLKMQEEAFDMERERSNETINDLVLQVEKWKELFANKEEEAENFQTLNIECMEELKTKQHTIEKLEDKVILVQMDQKRSTTMVRSLEAQLKSSEDVIRNLKKEIKDSQSTGGSLKSSTSRSSKQLEESRPSVVMLPDSSVASDPSDEESNSALQLAHLEDESKKIENKAEEIFQRSRSTRSKLRRSLIVVPTTLKEESSEASDDKEYFAKSYSLRSKSERRRSFQPRRYMGGHTPPNKRTLIGDPMQVQMSTFNTDNAEEPEVDYDWDRIQTLKESVSERDMMEEHRLQELQRRNTLCLPHLRSAYPMELSVDKENNVPERLIRDPNAGTKRRVEEEGPRGTYKKCRTESNVAIASDLSYLGRSTQSDSNLRRDASRTNQAMQQNSQSCSFEITMEPAKASRPKLARSLASGNLRTKPAKNTTAKPEKPVTKPEPKKNRSTEKVGVPLSKQHRPITRSSSREALKPENSSRFNRGEGVRNSFKSATQKVAASLRGKRSVKK